MQPLSVRVAPNVEFAIIGGLAEVVHGTLSHTQQLGLNATSRWPPLARRFGRTASSFGDLAALENSRTN